MTENKEEFIIKMPDCNYEIDPKGLGNAYFEHMKKYKDRIAQYLADSDEEETFETLLKKSIRTAIKMKSLGINKNDIISLCTGNHSNSCIPFIAAQFIRATVANLDPTISEIDSIHLLKQVKPKMIFVSEDGVKLIENSIKQAGIKTILVVFGATTKHIPFTSFLQSNPKEEANFKPDCSGNNKDTALILFSSGTTGLPKGICLNHSSILTSVQQSVEYWDTNNASKRTIGLSYSTLYWISSTVMLSRAVFLGESRVICSKFDAEEWWKLVDKYKITFSFVGPSTAIDILRAKRSRNIDTSCIKFFVVGGSPVTLKLMNDLFKTFPTTCVMQAYGQTEVAGIVTTFNTFSLEDIELQKRKPLSCGKGVRGYWYKIVNPETDEILGPNQKGEIRFKLEYKMNGYYNMDSSSAYDNEGWLKSGDMGYYDEDKCFFIVDRLKEVLKYQNFQIMPAALENIIDTHPDVREAVVIGIPHAKDGDHPMGIVILNEDAKTTEYDIEKYVEERVVDRQRLRGGVKIVNNLPRTVTGKIKRRSVKEMVLTNKI